MILIYAWPDGTWAFDYEVYKPEPGYVVLRLPDHTPENLIQEYVNEKVSHHDERI